MEVVRSEQREPYVTRDGSTVRELAGPDEPLVLLCCSTPPYSHEDTVLCE
jgi:hypothetical protein